MPDATRLLLMATSPNATRLLIIGEIILVVMMLVITSVRSKGSFRMMLLLVDLLLVVIMVLLSIYLNSQKVDVKQAILLVMIYTIICDIAIFFATEIHKKRSKIKKWSRIDTNINKESVKTAKDSLAAKPQLTIELDDISDDADDVRGAKSDTKSKDKARSIKSIEIDENILDDRIKRKSLEKNNAYKNTRDEKAGKAEKSPKIGNIAKSETPRKVKKIEFDYDDIESLNNDVSDKSESDNKIIIDFGLDDGEYSEEEKDEITAAEKSSELNQMEPIKQGHIKSEPTISETTRHKPARHESAKHEPARHEPTISKRKRTEPDEPNDITGFNTISANEPIKFQNPNVQNTPVVYNGDEYYNLGNIDAEDDVYQKNPNYSTGYHIDYDTVANGEFNKTGMKYFYGVDDERYYGKPAAESGFSKDNDHGYDNSKVRKAALENIQKISKQIDKINEPDFNDENFEELSHNIDAMLYNLYNELVVDGEGEDDEYSNSGYGTVQSYDDGFFDDSPNIFNNEFDSEKLHSENQSLHSERQPAESPFEVGHLNISGMPEIVNDTGLRKSKYDFDLSGDILGNNELIDSSAGFGSLSLESGFDRNFADTGLDSFDKKHGASQKTDNIEFLSLDALKDNFTYLKSLLAEYDSEILSRDNENFNYMLFEDSEHSASFEFAAKDAFDSSGSVQHMYFINKKASDLAIAKAGAMLDGDIHNARKLLSQICCSSVDSDISMRAYEHLADSLSERSDSIIEGIVSEMIDKEEKLLALMQESVWREKRG